MPSAFWMCPGEILHHNKNSKAMQRYLCPAGSPRWLEKMICVRELKPGVEVLLTELVAALREVLATRTG
jgi:hypothetical protein